MFFVAKKSGQLRLIIDCRTLNQRLRKPPKTALATSAAFCELFIPAEESLRFSSHDVSDCFYQFAVPPWLRKILGLRAVRAGDVGVYELNGVRLCPDDMIIPVLNVLPMGFPVLYIGRSKPT